VAAHLDRLDVWQRRHPPAAFVFAVVKKFGDDQGGDLAALVAYYGFLSLFPLLLVLVSVLGFVLQGHSDLADQLSRTALRQIPVLGQDIKAGRLHKSGVGLVVGLVGALYGGLGVASAAQNAMNRVWGVPRKRWPNMVKSLERSALLAVAGFGILATTALGGGAGAGSHLGLVVRLAALGVSLGCNVGLILFALWVLTVADVSGRDLWPGALVAAAAWQVLQALGGYYVSHQLKGASNVYGAFAFVIVLLGWLYLEAEVLLLAAEINVVRARRLWPRALVQGDLTASDYEALRQYAAVECRHPAERVEVSFAPAADAGRPTTTAAAPPAPTRGAPRRPRSRPRAAR